MEGCKRCTLSPSIDGHWSHVSIFLLTKVITKINIILDMQFPFLPVVVKWKVVKDVHCPLLLMTQVSHLYLPADKSYYKKNVNIGHEITFSISKVKIEGCERCTLSPSIDRHWSHISIFLLMKDITNRMLIVDVQFPFLSVGVKWKVVKDVHCPLLLMTLVSHLYLPADKSYYNKNVHF